MEEGNWIEGTHNQLQKREQLESKYSLLVELLHCIRDAPNFWPLKMAFEAKEKNENISQTTHAYRKSNV